MIKALIIGGGDSTEKLIKHKNKILNEFGIVIGVGGSFMEFDDYLTHHLVTEKHFTELDILNKGDFRKDLPRLVNFKSLHRYNKKYNLIPVTRSQCPENFDTRKFINTSKKNVSGLVIGKINSTGLALGSVVLQAIHLASINGADKIYTIGVDLRFNSGKDHFYGGRFYRDRVSKHPNAPKVVKVGKYDTTDYFRDSASEIDRFMKQVFTDIEFLDFSDGLLTYPRKIKIEDFLGGK